MLHQRKTLLPLIAVAPMMGYTDRHDRYFLRLIAPSVQLYTEMIATQALIHGKSKQLLAFHPTEYPLVLQLGGCNPRLLAQCARMGEEVGYSEVNLNVGCPSPRVNLGRFGACLMLEPNLVAECVATMQAAVNIPISIKCRVGIDQHDTYELLYKFVQLISAAGCQTFIIHARKAWLSGLSPKENRELPPLCYGVVHHLKRDFPKLTIVINGGIKTIAQIDEQIRQVDGVMIGREAYRNPYFLSQIQARYFYNRTLTREEVIAVFTPYVSEQLRRKARLATIIRHILGLFHGQRGANVWRRYLSQQAYQAGAGTEVITQALSLASSYYNN
jgi:tRNA-dihydrouridine synthase A